ncbi:hypothetical protein CEXT_800381 [Caerostris extrusa]|uniref:Uncharacterized protein n=1 Tax=Caerostris extrusa TaxID=172846 RepID=A0AAV4RGC3_CAEEX|nr:hypothetical protein CEXT_800381 [Caerostris extrusa]
MSEKVPKWAVPDLGNLMDPGPLRIRQSGLIYLRGKCIKHFGSEFSNCTLASGLAKRTAKLPEWTYRAAIFLNSEYAFLGWPCQNLHFHTRDRRSSHNIHFHHGIVVQRRPGCSSPVLPQGDRTRSLGGREEEEEDEGQLRNRCCHTSPQNITHCDRLKIPKETKIS